MGCPCLEYPGLTPSNVKKDAKYSVRYDSEKGDYVVKLTYEHANGIRELLATHEHPDLVRCVNEVKECHTGAVGGAFYVNEFRHVVVPTEEGHMFAGCFDGYLDFEDEDQNVISPRPRDGLAPGDRWPGPHVGIRYKLKAGGNDISYTHQLSANRTLEVSLSATGGLGAKRLANRIADVKGRSGGRIYINECGELFGPVDGGDGYYEFRYFGPLEEDPWFEPPEGMDCDDPWCSHKRSSESTT